MSAGDLTVVTFNIHHGLGRDGVLDLDRTAALITDLDADLVALQEIDVGLSRSGRIDEARELEQRLEMNVHFFPTLSFDGGQYGVALASHGELECRPEVLPRFATEEPRLALVGHWKGIGIVATHLSRDRRARRLQTEHIASLAGSLGPDSLIAGDLNQPAADLGPLFAAGFSGMPPRSRRWTKWRRPIDHILVREGLELVRSTLIPTIASDHPALQAVIRRRTQA